MKEIYLSAGKYAIVDDEDYEHLNQLKWSYDKSKNSLGYAHRVVNKKKIRMHRLLMNAPEGMEVDHINRNGLDNRKENLRLVDRSQNCRNKSKQSNNKTGYIGVCWDKEAKKYAANIKIGSRFVRIGRYESKEFAALVRDVAACAFYDGYANFNILKARDESP